MDLSVAAAALEALTLGWPETPGLAELHDTAVTSREPTLRLVGISGRLATRRADRSDRDRLVDLLSEFPKIDYWDQPAARMMLSQHWPDDPSIIRMALDAVRRDRRRGQFEPGSAMHYLVRCSPTNSTVADLVRQELKDQYPFALGDDDLWDRIAVFSVEHPDIKASVIDCVRSEFGKHTLYHFQNLIIRLGGDDLRDALIGIARDVAGWSEFWAVRPLLEGWGRSDPIVASFMGEIASWNDKKLENLAEILPQILTDFDTCRTRLLSLARGSEHPRFDLIARGLAALGCTAADTEVVDTLLDAVGKDAPAYDPGVTLITHFSANPRVRQYAQKMLSGRESPLAALARAYENDTSIRPQILAYANPLPVTLRSDIAEVVRWGGNSHVTFERMLKDYDIEADSELKIVEAIHYHRCVARTSNGPSADHLKRARRRSSCRGAELT
jgi:hypothetical protein